MAPSNHRLNASQHQDLSRCSFTDALAVQGRPLRLPISHRPPSTQKRSRIDTARQQQFERPICRQDPSPDSGRSSALDHHYDGSSSVHEDRSDVSINDRASSSETGSHSSAVDVACADALDRLEKLSFQQMQSELDVHAEFIRASQQRAAIAARGEYLYKRIHGTLEDQRLRLEPRTFGWTEKPWVLGQASSRNWIGDTAYSPTGITESDLEAEIWSAMRHGEAASFPLESGRVSEEVFAGLLHAMVDDDLNALSQQWQARGVRRGAEEPKVSRDGGTRVEIREALRSGTRRITFNEVSTNRGVESRQEIDHDDSISENADTLFSASATPSGYGTPSHIRARSASPTMQSYNARGVPRVATMFRSPMPSRSQRRLEEDLRNAEARERAEISTKFRANPVPASSLVPRYHEIMRRMGNKSAESRSARSFALMMQVKPFSFCHDNSSSNRCSCKSRSNKVIEDAINSVDTAELSRRRKARSLANSRSNQCSLVESAAADGVKRRERLQESEMRAGVTDEHRFRPRINHDIPDHRRLQAEFQRQLEERKSDTRTTKPEPFQGVQKHYENSLLRRRSRSLDINPLKYYRRPQRPIYTPPPRVPPPCETRSSSLRNQHHRTQMAARELAKDEPAPRPKRPSSVMASKIRGLVAAHGQDKDSRSRSLKRDLAVSMREREEEYRRQLARIKGNLDERLCLFEQMDVHHAKLRARQDFERIVRDIK